MKKVYEVPSVELNVFDKGDCLSTSRIDTYDDPTKWATFEEQVVKQGIADAAVSYASYQW